jgi:hypothetical protein
MVFHGGPWRSMVFHGDSMVVHGGPWCFMAVHGVSWRFYGGPWCHFGVVSVSFSGQFLEVAGHVIGFTLAPILVDHAALSGIWGIRTRRSVDCAKSKVVRGTGIRCVWPQIGTRRY